MFKHLLKRYFKILRFPSVYTQFVIIFINRFFPEIFNKSGMAPLVKKFGDWFTYDKTPRALIFKRDAVKVTDLDSMTRLMR